MIDQVVDLAWVYDLADYRQMFDLSDEDLHRSIFDFPAGIASFNAQMLHLDHHVTSVDAQYHLSISDMKAYANQVCQNDAVILANALDRLQEANETTLDKITASWNQRKDVFLSDYEAGKAQGRYVTPTLPQMPFDNDAFELALCSDLLFNAHAASRWPAGVNTQQMILELCRIAEEVRIFPLMTETGGLSDELGPLMLLLQEHDYGVEVREVPFHQQVGGNAMLRVWSQTCDVG